MPSWPRGRRTTYNSGSTPAIKADDQNAYQDAIIDVNDCALFTPSVPGTDTPMAPFVDGAGKARFTIDHNALPIGGRVSLWREEWAFNKLFLSANLAESTLDSPDGSNTPVSPLWLFKASSGSACAIQTIKPGLDPTGLGPRQIRGIYCKMQNADPGAGSDMVSIATVWPLWSLLANQVIVLQWEAGTGATYRNVDHLIGLSTSGNLSGFVTALDALPAGAVYFRRNTLGWTGRVWDGAVGASTSLAIVPPTGGFDQFTLELHGPATPYGVLNGNQSVARFWVNGTHLGDLTSHVPASTGTPFNFSLQQAFAVGISSPTADTYLACGPIEASCPRELSPASP